MPGQGGLVEELPHLLRERHALGAPTEAPLEPPVLAEDGESTHLSLGGQVQEVRSLPPSRHHHSNSWPGSKGRRSLPVPGPTRAPRGVRWPHPRVGPGRAAGALHPQGLHGAHVLRAQGQARGGEWAGDLQAPED